MFERVREGDEVPLQRTDDGEMGGKESLGSAARKADTIHQKHTK